ncbi:hypothetical protein RRG08_035097 [Elysia crispata]|uniref:Uncharacterized protein n=1 Tax=Elysia crispata TaxID=231223 RepID=A0AAE0ZSL3_9GAST|nr:hypothetical protein RRG08_035097 [Elysia crispata]
MKRLEVPDGTPMRTGAINSNQISAPLVLLTKEDSQLMRRARTSWNTQSMYKTGWTCHIAPTSPLSLDASISLGRCIIDLQCIKHWASPSIFHGAKVFRSFPGGPCPRTRGVGEDA